MALELQLAHCDACSGYYTSTVLDAKDLNNPEIIDHYFYHGEPWFTLDKKTFDNSVDQKGKNIRIVDLKDHLKNDHRYCTCKKNATLKTSPAYSHSSNISTEKRDLKENIDNDIYFRDLYITYNNYHQDIPARQAI